MEGDGVGVRGDGGVAVGVGGRIGVDGLDAIGVSTSFPSR